MIREFFQPVALIKALQLRRDYEGSSLLAGGTDFVIAMHNDKGSEGSIIDLSKVSELKGIEAVGDRIRIGPMTTFTEISDSTLLRDTANMLCEAAESVGSPQIRNRGTIGGNICNASAAADGMTPLLCLDAEIELQSLDSDGAVNTLILSLEDFLVDSKKTALKGNEIMTGIFIKHPLADTLSSFQKIGRRNALAIARINGCCALRLNNDMVESIHFALGASTSKPERIRVVEEFLTGRELTAEVLSKAGKHAAEYVFQQTGTRSSSSYKLPVIERFTVSLIQAAAERRNKK
jgi:CO/xanthine dehydrogenase FAD-binding subunit